MKVGFQTPVEETYISAADAGTDEELRKTPAIAKKRFSYKLDEESIAYSVMKRPRRRVAVTDRFCFSRPGHVAIN